MFKRLALLLLVSSLTTVMSPATAQEESTAKSFITTQPCDRLSIMLEVIKGYKEELLFTGEGMTFSARDRKGFMGCMMFFTNQESGTWSMLQVYGDGTACLVQNGRHFEPYSGPQRF